VPFPRSFRACRCGAGSKPCRTDPHPVTQSGRIQATRASGEPASPPAGRRRGGVSNAIAPGNERRTGPQAREYQEKAHNPNALSGHARAGAKCPSHTTNACILSGDRPSLLRGRLPCHHAGEVCESATIPFSRQSPVGRVGQHTGFFRNLSFPGVGPDLALPPTPRRHCGLLSQSADTPAARIETPPS